MIRHELQVSTLRFYNTETDDPFAEFNAVCTVIWETPSVIWIRAFHGNLTRKTLRHLIQFFIEHEIITVKAHRSLARSLPGISVREGSFVEIDTESLIKRFSKK